MFFRVKKQITLLFILFLSTFFGYSQENNFQKIIAYNDFKSYKIKEIKQDQFNNVWLATNQGLLKYNGKTIINFNFKTDKLSSKINTLFCKNDSIFIGLDNQLCIKNADSLLAFDAKEIQTIYNYKNKIIVGTNEGVFYLNKHFLQPLEITYKIDFATINSIVFFNNQFIIGANNGLWQIDDIFNPKKIKHIDNGNYASFITTENALYTVKNNNEILEFKTTNKLISTYSKEQITNIYNIDNKLYISSKNDGIDVFDLANSSFVKRITKYNSSLNSNTINVVFKDAEKNIFIATENDLYVKKNNKLIENTSLNITDISVNYVSLKQLNQDIYTENLHLKPNQNNLSFLWEAVSINKPENIEYRYKLNTDFSPWQNINQINFANLKSGKYQFTVQSRFKNQKKISTKNFSFFIDTPFYQKIWFYILCGVVFCLLLAGIVDLYIRKLKKKNKQKIDQLKLKNHLLSLEQKALQLQMNPHFIFNVLNGIKALGNSGNSNELNKTVSQFSSLLRGVLNNSRLEEISLKDEIDTLKNYLELEQKMNSKPFKYSLKTSLKNIDSEEILIPPMLLQPFVENCIKHAFTTTTKNAEIKLFFEVKNKFLHFTIEDNGVGFHQTKKEKTEHKSVALKVTKERIQNLSKYNLFSIKEINIDGKISGTVVSFKIPLKTDY
ncbi:sensor histidine kinase [Polaribacter sargassicola]|uniref:sensor histidine kinase n=1 Tax=Polaribacter sargassicola TaxID=2836891 RepID=UPI001EFFDD99|nr:histidine kinase [Polaribacter sp. DS7-9]MCG1036932.1 histidine kinase [Polaribacter sp. DS7-9]